MNGMGSRATIFCRSSTSVIPFIHLTVSFSLQAMPAPSLFFSKAFSIISGVGRTRSAIIITHIFLSLQNLSSKANVSNFADALTLNQSLTNELIFPLGSRHKEPIGDVDKGIDGIKSQFDGIHSRKESAF